MTPSEFFHRYVDTLPHGTWCQFADDLIAVVKHERDRQRRQLTTDRTAYEAACLETMAEATTEGATPYDGHH